MFFLQLPEDCIWYITNHLDYLDLLKIFPVARIFANLSSNSIFWKSRISLDFGIQTSGITTRENYIELAGDKNIPVPGSDKYGDIHELTINVARLVVKGQLSVDILTNFFRESQKFDLFSIFGRYNRLDLIQYFIDQFPQFDRDISRSSFRGAISGKHQELILHLIDRVGIVKSKCISAYTFIARRNQDLDTLRLLMIYGDASPNNCLLSAAEIGNLSAVQEFINMGGDDYNGALSCAAYYSRYEIINLLLNLGADNYDLALRSAARGGNLSTVRYFLNLGGRDLNKALIGAAQMGREEIVNELILLGADDLGSALLEAIGNNQEKICQYLITKGTPINENVILKAVEIGNWNIYQLVFSKANRGLYLKLLEDAITHKHLDIFNHLFSLVEIPESDIIFNHLPPEIPKSNIISYIGRLIYNSPEFFAKFWSINNNKSDNFKDFCLIMASGVGNLPLVKYLLKLGAKNVGGALKAGAKYRNIVYYITRNYPELE